MSVAATASQASSTTLRPSLARSKLHPPASTPRTPDRGFPSSLSYSSPSFAGRSADDPVVLEFGGRFLRAGFAGDSSPLYCLDFGPSQQQRAGDYRQWEYTREGQLVDRKRNQDGIEAYELWPIDLRTVDLGLIEDKIERAVRHLYTRNLVVEPKSRRVSLVLPPALPHALLSILLTTLFGKFQCPNMTILSSPVLSTIAAGVRSSLVIDVGWSETVITGVFEYREIRYGRSVRAGKMLLQEMNRFLAKEVEKAQGSKENDKSRGNDISFEETEEVLTRFAWCRGRKEAELCRDQVGVDQTAVAKQDKGETSHEPSESREATISLPLQSTVPPTVLRIPFDCFANPVEDVFFKQEGVNGGIPDDEELPLGYLAYRALLALPIDARAICMSRIIVVGGCSRIPGVKRRVLDEIARFVEEREWEMAPQQVQASKPSASGLARTSPATRQPVMADIPREPEASLGSVDEPTPSSSGLDPLEIDPITKELDRVKAKGTKPIPQGFVRGIESLGAWSGASILAGLKIRGIVEVEKDKFLQQGLWGAGRGVHPSVEPRQSSMVSGTTKGAGDRSSWNLGAWA
ncbi:MAG: hypothetical protein M1816_004187 [Peltula sp. TS41687]|nr:MAG: hypothetical protein M1816_004187 [Peltula sp. TS41687]